MAATVDQRQGNSQEVKFQSPIHRVNGCNVLYFTVNVERHDIVSVPYSSGQWLQLQQLIEEEGISQGFSPLFIGSMAATKFSARIGIQEDTGFSPLFIGSMAATLGCLQNTHVGALKFQSPIHRVNGCNSVQ